MNAITRHKLKRHAAEALLIAVFIVLGVFAFYLGARGLHHEFADTLPPDEPSQGAEKIGMHDECTHWQPCPQKWETPADQ